mmetsp:Transcript_6551/g.15047  ORF Transcript_6551/g.15047 Transcript_6551/m.15047 type:complete len:261 (+) Transcript_6551:468-1250(+)
MDELPAVVQREDGFIGTHIVHHNPLARLLGQYMGCPDSPGLRRTAPRCRNHDEVVGFVCLLEVDAKLCRQPGSVRRLLCKPSACDSAIRVAVATIRLCEGTNNAIQSLEGFCATRLDRGTLRREAIKEPGVFPCERYRRLNLDALMPELDLRQGPAAVTCVGAVHLQAIVAVGTEGVAPGRCRSGCGSDHFDCRGGRCGGDALVWVCAPLCDPRWIAHPRAGGYGDFLRTAEQHGGLWGDRPVAGTPKLPSFGVELPGVT